MKSAPKKKKPVTTKTKKNKFFRGGAKNGALYAIAILAIVATFGGVMAGGAIPTILQLRTPPPPANPFSCCDSGDGPNCHPILEKQIVFNGDNYALLKSKIYQGESGHIAPAELDGYPESYTPDGRKIFVNISDTKANYTGVYQGCERGKDLIGIKDPSNPSRRCFGVPNEQLIYVCTDTEAECSENINEDTVPFDVYFRLKDGQVPAEIASFCPKPPASMPEEPQRVVLLPTPSGTANLQLETFTVEQQKETYTWLGAWCKPADYFYPKQKTDIHFDVKPKGKFTYTSPEYTPGGWRFTAFPDGNIIYRDKNYPYIYWDAAIPNNLIQEPRDGYSVAYSDLPGFLNVLLPKMGLNQKETGDFVNYWVKQLPESKYYFIGILPKDHINNLAPISVNPQPDSVLRVSLFFKAMDEKISVPEPKIDSFTRTGFTVVEWGGIFDTQKHPGFSCLL
jgi:hypothetical protein